jgi:YD repeat-containing protein
MKKVRLVLGGICALFVLSGCGNKIKTEYYRHVDIVGMNRIILKYPVNPDTILDPYYFKVIKDGKNRILKLQFPDVGGQGLDPKMNAASIEISRTRRHEIWRYFNRKGIPVNVDGFYAEDFELDRSSRIISDTRLDKFDKPSTDSAGVSKYLITTDQYGLPTDFLRLNLEGDTIADTDSNYCTHYEYGEHNLVAVRSNYDAKGALTAVKDGFAITRNLYDSNKNLIERAYFDIENKPIAINQSGTARYIYTYNEKGSLVEWRQYGVSRELIEAIGPQYPIIQVDYWKNGRPCRYRYLDSNFVQRKLMKYTDRGILRECNYFDSQGRLQNNDQCGYASYKVKFDDNGNPIERAYYDESEKLVMLPDFGYAIARLEYDNYNRLIKTSFLDCDGKLIENKKAQYAFVTYSYDSNRKTKTATFRDLRGFPQKREGGYAVRVTYYDHDWQLLNKKYFDETGAEVSASILAGDD